MSETRTQRKVARFANFWQRTPAERPILGLRLHSYYPLETFRGGPRKGYVRPDMLRAEDFIPDFERLQAQYDQSMGDEIHAASAYYGIPWLEAILGCPVEIRGASMWAEPCLVDWSTLNEIRFDPENPWFLKLLELTEETAQYFAGEIPVGPPLLRGPADIAAAIRGNATFCMDLLDNPDRVSELLNICTAAYIELTQALLAKCPKWFNGFVEPIRHVWAPGRTVETQVDVSSLISPAHYRKAIKSYDAEVLKAFDFIYIHLHGSSRHILDEVLSIEPLAAIEFSLDVGGPSVLEFHDEIQKILEHKPLILQGVFSAEDLLWLCKTFPSEGFYIFIVVDSLEQGNKLLNEVFEVCGYTPS